MFFSDLLLRYPASKPLRSSGTGSFSVLNIKTIHDEEPFTFYAPHISNKLPENCSSAAFLGSFKSRLKTFLFASAFH